jgi:hypothetical protein
MTKLKIFQFTFAPPDGALSVNDGQTQSGWIVKRGAEFIAFGATGERLGEFKTLAAAMAAIPVNHERNK